MTQVVYIIPAGLRTAARAKADAPAALGIAGMFATALHAKNAAAAAPATHYVCCGDIPDSVIAWVDANLPAGVLKGAPPWRAFVDAQGFKKKMPPDPPRAGQSTTRP